MEKSYQVIDTKTQQSFSLESGQYSFNAVATDPDKENRNSYTIKPETLTMKRGETAIVSVTVKPTKNAAPQVASLTNDKLIFQGNTFSQWIRILRSNRDYKTQSSVIEACLAIMETDEEQQQILEGTRTFMKTLSRKFGPGEFSISVLDRYRRSPNDYRSAEVVQFYDLIRRVLDSCDRTFVFDFFKTEVDAGTPLSQQVCSSWLATRAGRAAIFDRYMELNDTFAKNFDKPAVREMVSYLLAGASLQGESRTQLQESSLGRKLKEFVQTVPPEVRGDVLPLAFEIFPDDQQVLQAYQKDLLDPNLNSSRVRSELFKFMVDKISNVEYYESPNVDATTRQQRLATATDWLAEAIDGYLDQQLDFKEISRRYPSRRYPEGVRTIPFDVKQRMLQSFYDIGSRSDDIKIKQILLPKLEKLKESLVKAGEMKRTGRKRDNFRMKTSLRRKKQSLADLNYVIAVFQGNTPAELPPNSKLIKNIDPLIALDGESKPTGTSEPGISSGKAVTKSKPVFEGNTFAQWLGILESNRDYKSQAKALEACLAIMQTNQEQKQILEGARVFLKSLDHKFGATAFSKTSFLYYQHQAREKDRPKAIVAKQADLVRFHELLIRVLNSCDQSLVFDFFKTEIQDNTRLSQQILWNWLRDPGRSGNSRMIKDRYAELVNPFAENFDKRLVRAMTGYIVVSAARRKHQSLTGLQESALGVKIKEFVQTQTPAKRIEVLDLAFGIFPDDQQVLETYQEDLLDPKLNNVFDDLSRGGPRNWIFAKSVHARTKLFTFVQEHIWDKQYYEDPNVNAKTRKQRLATAADSLAKVVDGVVAVGDRRLEFTRNWAVIRGEREIRAYDIFEMTALFLHNICDIRSASNDPKVKQLLLTKLQELKESILKKEVKRELSDLEKKERTQTLADLDYAIAVFQGNTSAERPPNSKLRIRKVKESE